VVQLEVWCHCQPGRAGTLALIMFCSCSTTQPAPHLDGVHVVFGHVLSGQDVVSHIEGLPVDRMCRPLQDAKVVNCGELVLKMKVKDKKVKKKPVSSSSSSSSSTDSDSDTASDAKKKRKKKKEKKKKRKQKKEKSSSKKSNAGSAGHVDSEAEEGEVPDEGELHPLVTVTNINPDEIPDVPPNRFLYRGERQTSINNRSKADRNPREHERRHRSRIRGITKSGRVIKGRGVFVSMT